MPALFVPEEQWAPRSWAINHPLTITAQIHHGLVEAGVRLLGLLARPTSPRAATPEYGVDAIGMNPEGYTSNDGQTTLRRPRASRAARAASRSPTRRRPPTRTAS